MKEKKEPRRAVVSVRNIDDAIEAFKTLLWKRLEQKGMGTFASSHEIYGVLAEEMKELLDAIHEKPNLGAQVTYMAASAEELEPLLKQEKSRRQEAELMDIAVGAIFGVACLRENKMDWL